MLYLGRLFSGFTLMEFILLMDISYPNGLVNRVLWNIGDELFGVLAYYYVDHGLYLQPASGLSPGMSFVSAGGINLGR